MMPELGVFCIFEGIPKLRYILKLFLDGLLGDRDTQQVDKKVGGGIVCPEV